MVRKTIPGARAIPRDAGLEKVNNQEKQNKINFNTAYHPVFEDVRSILEELNVILASNNGLKDTLIQISKSLNIFVFT